MTREEAVGVITDRLVAQYQPERIYLFGSTARGDNRPDSDIDIMVLLKNDAPDEVIRRGALPSYDDLGYSQGIVVWREGEFDRRLHIRTSFPSVIVREGRLLYDRVPIRV